MREGVGWWRGNKQLQQSGVLCRQSFAAEQQLHCRRTASVGSTERYQHTPHLTHLLIFSLLLCLF